MAQTLAIIDGHALAYRAYHALREAGLSTSEGEPTFAVFGFCQILLTMLHERHPDYVAVSFDVGRTFRHEAYAEYKATRKETPDDFRPQLERIKQVVQALNIPIYTAQGFEADDVIGTLAKQATAQHVQTLIVTGDTDTLQLVDDHVHVLLANPYQKGANTTEYDLERVVERYEGLQPAQLADLRGLKGDTSDNIPGVKGIGEKGAINLLKEFGSIEALYEQLDAVPPRYRKVLDGQQEQALFSKHLATITTETPVTLDLDACRVHEYDRDAVVQLFQQLQFRNLLARLPANGTASAVAPLPDTLPPAAAPLAAASGPAQLSLFGDDDPAAAVLAPATPLNALGSYTTVSDEAALQALVGALNAAQFFAFDVESSSLNSLLSDLVGISLSLRSGTGYYIPLGHEQGEQLPAETVLRALRPFFADVRRPKYAHNGKFDMQVLARAGIAVEGLAFDSLIAAALLGKAMGLKELAFNELGLLMTPIDELIGRGKNQITMAQVPIERAAIYAAAGADGTLLLVDQLRPHLITLPAIAALFERVEMPLVPVLTRLEQQGIAVDVPFLQSLGVRLGERLATIEQQVFAIAGHPFNIGSGQQLNDVLFKQLELPTTGLSKTKTGQYSLTAQSLEELRGAHEIVDLILSHRQLTKLKSTYVDSLPSLINPETGRIHTSLNQMGAATGRLSSSDPNLQNIPIRTEEGREIRRAFVPREGCQFVAADYSQIELRVLAHVTEDPALLETFTSGGDIHATTAAALFGVPAAEVSKNQRRVAKTIVFGVIYGISSFGLAPRIGTSRQEAQRLIDELFARYPGIKRYIEQTLEDGRRDGYVQTLFGRRRYFDDSSWRGPRRQATEREAINAPIQGTSADLIKMAMVRLDHELRAQNMASRLLLQVHDELLVEAPHDEVAAVAELMCAVMEGVFPDLRVPLRVDVEAGSNWDEMQPLAR